MTQMTFLVTGEILWNIMTFQGMTLSVKVYNNYTLRITTAIKRVSSFKQQCSTCTFVWAVYHPQMDPSSVWWALWWYHRSPDDLYGNWWDLIKYGSIIRCDTMCKRIVLPYFRLSLASEEYHPWSNAVLEDLCGQFITTKCILHQCDGHFDGAIGLQMISMVTGPILQNMAGFQGMTPSIDGYHCHTLRVIVIIRRVPSTSSNSTGALMWAIHHHQVDPSSVWWALWLCHSDVMVP